ncbi:hypothetical protein [Bradyrhizobium sp. USDA 4353]
MAKDSFRKTISTEDAVTTRSNATFEQAAGHQTKAATYDPDAARSADRTRQIFPNHIDEAIAFFGAVSCRLFDF